MPSYIRGRHLFGARERKDMRLCWDNRRAPKRYTMAGEFENTLRESMGILCTHENVFRPLHPRPRHKLWGLHHSRCSESHQEAPRTRLRSNAKFALPYIERFMSLSLWMKPSTGPLLQLFVSPARTAARSFLSSLRSASSPPPPKRRPPLATR